MKPNSLQGVLRAAERRADELITDFFSLASTTTENDPMSVYAEVKPGYRVGDDGSVWSCVKKVPLPGGRGGTAAVITDEWHRLKSSKNPKTGYQMVSIGRNNAKAVHRLVLEAFAGPCPEGMECRHLDGNRDNNSLDNLRWGTRKENGEDRVRHGTTGIGSANGRAKLTEEGVREVRGLHSAKTSYRSLADKFNISIPTVRDIVTGRTWKHVHTNNGD